MSEVIIDILKKTSGFSYKKAPFRPRASGIYKACMRQLVLCTKLDIPVSSYVNFSQKMTFEIGNAIHYWFQNNSKLLGDIRCGFWKCGGCGKTTSFSRVPKRGCRACGAGSDTWTYDEYELDIKKPYYVTGHPDMFIELERGRFHVMEFKSINSAEFKTLEAPIIEHIWQLQTYMWACEQDSFKLGINTDPEEGYIMYISKAMDTPPIKVFTVKKDRHILKQIMSKLKDYKNGIDKKKPPPYHPICEENSFNNYMAKSCPVKEQCLKFNV